MEMWYYRNQEKNMERKLRHLIKVVFLLACVLLTDIQAKTLYVDTDANEPGTGKNWTEAFNTLQLALSHAESGDTILVAQGIYKPDSSNQIPVAPCTTFNLLEGLTLRGGYAGLTHDDPNVHDPVQYPTILSGDLLGNDDPNDRFTYQDNSYHVLSAIDIHSVSIQDITISHGYAQEPYMEGGGVYAVRSELTFQDCAFKLNLADENGGALFLDASEAILIDCDFSDNSSFEVGGAITSQNSNTSLINCQFTNNRGGDNAGAISHKMPPTDSANASLRLIQCQFLGNRGDWAGAVRCSGNLILDHCLFADNFGYLVGGLLHSQGHAAISHCTFAYNQGEDNDESGGALYFQTSTADIRSSIVWGNSRADTQDYIAQIRNRSHSPIHINHCCIQAWKPTLGGQANLSLDPLFVDPLNRDFHLQSKTGRYDPVQDTWIQDNITSPCIEAGDPNESVGLEPMPNGCIANLGCFGGTIQASLSDSPMNCPVPEPNSAYGARALYWTDKDAVKIQRFDLATYQLTDLLTSVNGLIDPRGIALDISRQHMYWCDNGTGQIYRSDLTGQNTIILAQQLSGPSDLALDKSAQVLYWAERDSGRIAYLDLSDPNATAQPLITNTNQPYYIALDTIQRHLYWNAFKSPIIYRVNLNDADDTQSFTAPGLDRLRDLVVEQTSKRLVWADRDTAKIQYAPLDNLTNVTTLFAGDLDRPHGMVLDPIQSTLYWTDTRTRSIHTGNLLSGTSSRLVTQLTGPWGIDAITVSPDITGDDRVDTKDITALLDCWGQSASIDNGFCAGTDLNANGIVDFTDLMWLCNEI